MIMMMGMSMIWIILKIFNNINENLLFNIGVDFFYIFIKGV